MDYWYVLRSKPRQENRAIESFKEQGLVAYCPMLNRVEPLFPRYFFLQDTIKAHSAWFRVRSTWGVQDLFSLVNGLPERLMRWLMASGIKKGRCLIVPVLIMMGSQRVFPRICRRSISVQCENGEDRCIVLCHVIESQRCVNTPLGQLSMA